MTISKTTMSVGAIAFAALFGGGFYLLMNFADLTKPILEKLASDTLGVSVTIDKLDINLQEKSASASGIKVANPKGFKGANAVNINNITIAIDTLSKELITFEKIILDGMNVNLIVQENGTNLQTLKNNIANSKTDKKSSANAHKDQAKLIIKNLKFREIQLQPSSPYLAGKLEPINMDDAFISNIGVKEGGVSPQMAMAQVSSKIIAHIGNQAAKNGLYKGLSPEALKNLGVSQVENLKNQLSNELDTLKKNIPDFGKIF